MNFRNIKKYSKYAHSIKQIWSNVCYQLGCVLSKINKLCLIGQNISQISRK